MIVFLRTSDTGIDSRLRRYVAALQARGLTAATLYWDRSGSAIGLPNVREFRYHAAGYLHRPSFTAAFLILFALFAIWKLWIHRREIELVHAIDLDTAIPALISNRLWGLPYVFDVYDHYADSRGLSGRAARLANWIEHRAMDRADRIILADHARVQQHGLTDLSKLLVVENVPMVEAVSGCGPRVEGPLRIGYLGTLEARFRGIEDMLDLVEAQPDLELELAGTGVLQDLVRARAEGCPRIRYHGPLPHDEGLRLMSDCDLILGLYYRDVANHRFAAPNKYFEHLLLGRALLTSRGTPPGDKVEAEGTGWAVEDGTRGIQEALQLATCQRSLVQLAGKKAAALWQARFADYFERVICGDYVDAVLHSRRPIAA